MDEDLHLLLQTQLCSLLAQRLIITQNVLLGSGQNSGVCLTLERIDAQILRLRTRGVSL